MTEKITPIETEVGFINGRDAIFLQSLNMVNEATFCITGELIGGLCSKINDDVDCYLALRLKACCYLK